MNRLAIAISAVLVPGVAAAHPDHTGGGDYGLVHFVTDPFHLAMTSAAVLLYFAVRRSLVRSRATNRDRR